MLKAALLLLLALCSTVAAAAPCEDPTAIVWNVTASDAGLTACFQDGASCWTFDGTAWTPASAKATPAPGDGDTNRGLGQPADTSADGKRTAVSGDNYTLQLVDAATKQPIATIARWKTPMMDSGFQSYGFVGDTFIAWLSDSPVSSQAKLYNKRGKVIAKLGIGDIAEHTALDLGKNRWLFPEFEGTEAYVYDVTSGAKLATLALASKRAKHDGGGMNDAIIALAGGKVWAMQGPADSGAVVYDVATRTQRHVPLPVCKK
jgi:hypothetical protein